MKTGRMLVQIPRERVRSVDGSYPRIGDVVVLDQGLTFPDGKPGGLVCFLGPDGRVFWEAEVYASEIEPSFNP